MNYHCHIKSLNLNRLKTRTLLSYLLKSVLTVTQDLHLLVETRVENYLLEQRVTVQNQQSSLTNWT